MPVGGRNRSFGVYLAHPFQESHFQPLNVFQLAPSSLESPKPRAGLVIISWGVYPLQEAKALQEEDRKTLHI